MLNNKHFEDKAWDQMKGLLDKEMPEKVVPFWRRWHSLLLLLLLVPSSYLLYNYFNNSLEYSDNTLVTTDSFSLNSKNNKLSEANLLNTKNTANTSLVDASSISSEEMEPNSGESKLEKSKSKQVLQNKADYKQELATLNQNKINVNPSINSNSGLSLVSKKPINTIEQAYIQSKSISNDANKTKRLDPIVKNKINSFASDNTSEIVSNNEKSLNNVITRSDVKTIKRSKLASELISINALDLFNIDKPIISDLDLYKTNKYNLAFQVYAATNYISDFNVLSYSIGMETYLKKKYSSWSFGLGTNLEYFNFDRSINLINRENDAADNFLEATASGSNEAERISINRVYQINVPLIVKYNVNRLSFGIGLNNSFIIKELYPTLDLNSFSNADKNETYRMSFINSVDYSFSKAISTGLYFRYDLSDFSNGVNTSNKLHAIGGRVSYHFAR